MDGKQRTILLAIIPSINCYQLADSDVILIAIA